MTDQGQPSVLLHLCTAHAVARALHVVADLGIADTVRDRPRTAQELAAVAEVDHDALARVLRLLEAQGVFRSDGSGCWDHTETSQWLRSDHPESMRPFVRMMGMPFGWDPFTALDHAVRTGEPSVWTLDPGGPWSYLAAHRDQGEIFQQAMVAKAHDDVAGILAAYDFSRHRHVADIGGGQGHLIAAVLAAHEGVSGTLFDLPHVVESAASLPRLTIDAGDFFTDSLPQCDAYVLMNIIHDWDDERSRLILSAVAAAGGPGSAVLVVEVVMPPGPEPHWAKTLDILMLALTGGRERTLAEYDALLDAAGLHRVRVIPTSTAFSVIEARVA